MIFLVRFHDIHVYFLPPHQRLAAFIEAIRHYSVFPVKHFSFIALAHGSRQTELVSVVHYPFLGEVDQPLLNRLLREAGDPNRNEAQRAARELGIVVGRGGGSLEALIPQLFERAKHAEDPVGRHATLAAEARKGFQIAQFEQTDNPGIIALDGPGPDSVSRAIVSRRRIEGCSTIARIEGSWLTYDPEEGWTLEGDNERIEGIIRKHLRAGVFEGQKGLVKHRDSKRITDDVLGALKADVPLYRFGQLPLWAGEQFAPIEELVSFQNGLLHLPTGRFSPHTPSLVSLSRLPVDWVADVEEPTEWLSFLAGTASPSDIRLLRQWFGYLLTDSTKHQTALWMLGPPRSGKGTILRVLSKLLGRVSGATQVDEINGAFGLQSFLGKLHMSIGDAQKGAGGSRARVRGRLLSLIGEDEIEINRKYLPGVSLRLRTRITIASNELLDLADVEGAMAARFRFFSTLKSHTGKEDRGLEDRLLQELPAIAKWAVEGWRDLEANGFVENESTVKHRERLQLVNSVSEHVLEFLDERCCFDGGYTSLADLKAAYDVWSQQNGEPKMSKRELGKELRGHPKVKPHLRNGRLPLKKIKGSPQRIIPVISIR